MRTLEPVSSLNCLVNLIPYGLELAVYKIRIASSSDDVAANRTEMRSNKYVYTEVFELEVGSHQDNHCAVNDKLIQRTF